MTNTNTTDPLAALAALRLAPTNPSAILRAGRAAQTVPALPFAELYAALPQNSQNVRSSALRCVQKTLTQYCTDTDCKCNHNITKYAILYNITQHSPYTTAYIIQYTAQNKTKITHIQYYTPKRPDAQTPK